MGATERVIQFIEYKGITKYKFCKDLGFSNKFLDNSSNMGTDKACKILHHYPEINPEWLLTGEGSMLKSEVKKEVQPANNILLEQENAFLKEKNALLEENKALLQAENERLKAEIQALKSSQSKVVNQFNQPSQSVQPRR